MVAKFFVISTFNSVYVYTAELYPTVIRYGVSQSNKLVPFLMIIWKSMFPFSRPIRVLAHSFAFWATQGTCDIDLWDHYMFLENCPPTPPLSQNFCHKWEVSFNAGLGEG